MRTGQVDVNGGSFNIQRPVRRLQAVRHRSGAGAVRPGGVPRGEVPAAQRLAEHSGGRAGADGGGRRIAATIGRRPCSSSPSCSVLGTGDDGAAAAEEAAEPTWTPGPPVTSSAMAELVAEPPDDFAGVQQAVPHRPRGGRRAEVADVEVDDDRGRRARPPSTSTSACRASGTGPTTARSTCVEVDGDWKVAFTSPSLHPGVGEGDRLQRTRSAGPRGRPSWPPAASRWPSGVPGEQARLVGLAGPLIGGLRELTAPEAAAARPRSTPPATWSATDGVEAGFEDRPAGDPSGSDPVVGRRRSASARSSQEFDGRAPRAAAADPRLRHPAGGRGRPWPT